MTRRTPVNSRPVTSMRSVRSTSGRGRRSASATQATSVWTVCPVRASASCGLTSALTTASVTSSLAREPSAGGCGLGIVICSQHLFGRLTGPELCNTETGRENQNNKWDSLYFIAEAAGEHILKHS